MHWAEVAQTATKIADRNKLTPYRMWQHEASATSQPTEQEALESIAKGKGRIQLILPLA